MITWDFKKLIWFQYKIFVMSAPQVLIRQLTNWNIFVFPLKEVDNIEYTPWHKFVNFYLDFYLTVKRGMNLLGLARLFRANTLINLTSSVKMFSDGSLMKWAELVVLSRIIRVRPGPACLLIMTPVMTTSESCLQIFASVGSVMVGHWLHCALPLLNK